jgi:arginine decarboxylase
VPMTNLATRVYLCAASASHPLGDKNARDHASASVGLESLNLITLSSVLPPGVRPIDRDEFLASVRPGQEVSAIHGVCESNEPGQLISSTLSVAIPADPAVAGYVTELYESPGILGPVARRRTETMLLQLCADRYRVRGYDAEAEWTEGRRAYTLGGREVAIHTVQAEAVVNFDGDYTCALAAAVLLA